MTWPSGDVNTTGMDSNGDTPPREDFLSLAQKFNLLINHFSVFMRGLMTSASAADARTALDVPTRAGGNATGDWPINAQNVTGTVSLANGGTGQTSAAASFNALKQAATTTATGVVELATNAETNAGTAPDLAVTPAGVESHMFANDLGWGQSWTNVYGSRALATNYTNSTGRPIEIKVSLTAGGGQNATLTIGGLTLTQITWAGSETRMLSGIVPAGAVYQVTLSAGTVSAWAELR